MGFETGEGEAFEALFAKFLALADAKKEVYDHDVFYLVADQNEIGSGETQLYALDSFQVVSNDTFPIAFKQSIGANEPLRTGSYSANVTFTLSTTTP